MPVLPQLTQSQQEMLKQVLGNRVKLDEKKNNRKWHLSRKKIFVIIALIILTITGVGFFIESRNNNPEFVDLSENPIWKLLPNDENSTEIGVINEDTLIRNQTGQSIIRDVYSEINGRTSSLGLSVSGKIEYGVADWSMDKSLTNLVNNEDANKSRFEMIALDVNDKILSRGNVWVENKEYIYQETGQWKSVLYLPIGTNSIALKIRDNDKYLDRVYVDTSLPDVYLELIPSQMNYQSTLTINGEVTGNADKVKVTLQLINNDFGTQKILLPEIKIDNGSFVNYVALSLLDINNTSRWTVNVKISSMFGLKSFNSNVFTIVK